VTDRLAALLDGVEGWLTIEQASVLFDAVARSRTGAVVVEIGSFRGRSTIALAAALPAGGKVIAIDPHAGNDRGPRERSGFGRHARADCVAMAANLARAGVAATVDHRDMTSADAAGVVGEPVDVLFVDGAHDIGAARHDLVAWGAKVRPGGVMLVHDAFSALGVTAAIAVELVAGRRWRYCGRVGSLATYRADLGWRRRDRFANAARQLAQAPWFLRNIALKAALSLGLGRICRLAGRRVPAWPY
jgi:hypothetical protein